MVHVEIDIDASPEQVRAVVLDFAQYSSWHTGFMTNFRILPTTKPGLSLVAGDGMVVDFPGMKDFPVTVTRNDAEEFSWYGSRFLGIFQGNHYFKFESVGGEGKKTRFVHAEEHLGPVKVMFKEGWPLNKGTTELFDKYAKDLKKRVEGVK
ncbi:hypothetical protein B0J11DRAFT_297932 [Dendryphion nanum]|uniref:SRPBCC domain-containing protein n=1 Tax=Dendryphion nanum TaxID=256645 RepID=A0A9P9DY79_9PLEO|nr:hypothetical protein B0J11DRAFT_297932 [Dendryphion nanum]